MDGYHIIAFALALATGILVARAMGLHRVMLPMWRGMNGAARVLTALALALAVAVGGTKPAMLRGPSPDVEIPTWYSALGYPSSDTDGDGIPDCWERWTHTDHATDDAALDPDGDGVPNISEFIHQCDPICADTDGDGISDRDEIDGQTLGYPWADPLEPADFGAVEPDADTNGVPDAWDGSGIKCGFADADGDGFDDMLPLPAACDDNFDVAVTVTSSRSVLLSWGDSTNEAVVLPPCTNLAVRLRLSAADEIDIALLSADDGRGSLWKARASLAWVERPDGFGYETERERIRLGSGAILECAAPMKQTYIGPAVRVRGGLRSNDNDVHRVVFPLRRKLVSLYSDGYCCAKHGGSVTVHASGNNVEPPYAWTVDGIPVSVEGDALRLSAIPPLGVMVTCNVTNMPTYTLIPVEASVFVLPSSCADASTNIVGAAWDSMHNPTNALDHLPGVATNIVANPSPCPPTTNITYTVGWTHDELILHIRNLVQIRVQDNVDHCLGGVFGKGYMVDLTNYLCKSSLPVVDMLTFRVNGQQSPSHFVFDKVPKPRRPATYLVEVLYGVKVLDGLWIVDSLQSDKDAFDAWYSTESVNKAWLATIPLPPHSLVVSEQDISLGSGGTGTWSTPNEIASTFMHHDAFYDIRTFSPGQSGNQATYDNLGTMIISTIAAGSADRYAPYSSGGYVRPNFNHRNNDVYPYILSLQLDGNPVKAGNDTFPTSLDRPCLYQGPNVEKYQQCRPAVY